MTSQTNQPSTFRRFRDFRPTEHITHHDLDGKPRTLKVAGVVDGQQWQKGRRVDCLVVRFEGAKKGLVLNASINEVLALAFGDDFDRWTGKAVTLYPTTDDRIRLDDKRCVRVRIPKAGEKPPSGTTASQPEPTQVEPGPSEEAPAAQAEAPDDF